VSVSDTAVPQKATPLAATVLAEIADRWNGLTDAQRARVFGLVDQLHRATAISRSGRTMLGRRFREDERE
jgi:hypothetical protein